LRWVEEPELDTTCPFSTSMLRKSLVAGQAYSRYCYPIHPLSVHNPSHYSHWPMKPKYSCPQCLQTFSRNWNRREHCRTQHNYDPEPISRPPPRGQRKPIELISSTSSAAAQKFLKMMASSRFQQTGIRYSMGKPIANPMGSLHCRVVLN
jgi:hypothetical protein